MKTALAFTAGALVGFGAALFAVAYSHYVSDGDPILDLSAGCGGTATENGY